MDFGFHLRQGQQLLENQDADSIKKALQHFKTANEITEDIHVGKPKILYMLALGNLLIGNIEQSYRIAHKAKRSIDTAIENSIFLMDNMRQMLGEDDIDTLINHIEVEFPQAILLNDIEDDDFDENKLDFSLVDKIYRTVEKKEVKPQFSVSNLNYELIYATFSGMGRTNDDLIYFDKLKGDVLCHVQGYFASLMGDQSTINRRLVDRITNNEPHDYVDEDRYILIDRLLLSDFLDEFKMQAKGKEPFLSFIDYFSIEVVKDFNYDPDLTIADLAFSSHIQEKFREFFNKKNQNRIRELANEYTSIFESTCKSLALKWIQKNILNEASTNQTSQSSMELNFVFKSSDHLRYEDGRHVSGPHGGARRAVIVEPNISGGEGYTVTLYNLDGNHPVWQNNVQMAPKQMKVIQQTTDKIVLRGYGHDTMGTSFADYGLTIKLKNGKLENCILHMHNRGVDIEYLP